MRSPAALPAPGTPLILTPKDEAILRMLAKVRYATRLDVAHYCFTPGAETYAGGRLRRLAAHPDSPLVSFRLPTTRGNPEKIFALSGRGVALVRSLGYPEAASLRPAKLSSLSYSHLSHALALTRFLTCAEASARGHSGLCLLESHASYSLAGRPGLKVVPDGWCLLQKEENKYALWIEIDTGSEFFKRFSKLLEARLTFIRSGGYEQVFGTRSIMLCYLVSAQSAGASEARRRALADWMQKILSDLKLESWASIIRLVSAPRKTLLTTPLLTSALWHVPGRESPVCLFGP